MLLTEGLLVRVDGLVLRDHNSEEPLGEVRKTTTHLVQRLTIEDQQLAHLQALSRELPAVQGRLPLLLNLIDFFTLNQQQHLKVVVD